MPALTAHAVLFGDLLYAPAFGVEQKGQVLTVGARVLQ